MSWLGNGQSPYFFTFLLFNQVVVFVFSAASVIDAIDVVNATTTAEAASTCGCHPHCCWYCIYYTAAWAGSVTAAVQMLLPLPHGCVAGAGDGAGAVAMSTGFNFDLIVAFSFVGQSLHGPLMAALDVAFNDCSSVICSCYCIIVTKELKVAATTCTAIPAVVLSSLQMHLPLLVISSFLLQPSPAINSDSRDSPWSYCCSCF